MIGYVFISSGAIRTNNPGRYPARDDQIENIRFLIRALDRSPDDTKIVVEKVSEVTGLVSLPKLRACIASAAKGDQCIIVDDMRRIFYRCPREQRLELLKEILPIKSMIFEVARDGSPMSTRSKAEFEALMLVDRPVRFRVRPRRREERSVWERKQQTAAARRYSAKSRSSAADDKAEKLAAIKDDMLKTQAHVTNKALAEEANKREIWTTRGGPWSHSSVKRALDRLKEPG